MPQYRNKRTGAIITLPGVITGDVWEKIDAKPTKETKPAPEEVLAPVEEPKAKKPKKTESKAPKKSRSKKK